MYIEMMDVEVSKKIHQESKTCTDVKVLRKGINDLFGQFLLAADEVIDLRDRLDNLTKNHEMLQKDNKETVKRLKEVEECLRDAGSRRDDALSRISELEALSSTLTLWNTSMEEKCNNLEVTLKQNETSALNTIKTLQSDLIEATRKQIKLREDQDLLEDECNAAKRLLVEERQISEKIKLENMILKSKFNDSRLRGATPMTFGSCNSEGNQVVMPLPLTMENVDLNNNDSHYYTDGISDLLEQLRKFTPKQL